jgi:hypothetical protein
VLVIFDRREPRRWDSPAPVFEAARTPSGREVTVLRA